VAVPKSERLLNLLIMLLVARSYVSKARIREIHYQDTRDDAFDKMFERDKEELRSLGVPIEVGALDPMFGDEQGYRIRPEEFALPEINLAPDEAAVVGLATQVWGQARLAGATEEAVRKLTAAGIDTDLSGLDRVQPRLIADEPSFDAFFEAVSERAPVTFDYRRGGDVEVSRRRLQPWGVFRYRRRWYVLGHDLDRGEERLFRLSRVSGDVRRIGPAASYESPADADLGEQARRLAPEPAGVAEAVLLIRPGAARQLRTAAEESVAGVTGPDGRADWERVSVRRTSYDLAGEIIGWGADIIVESPPELREDVVARLRGAIA
jgi:proteasome accessory factor B